MYKSNRATQLPRASAPADEGYASEYLPKILPTEPTTLTTDRQLSIFARRPPASNFHEDVEFTPWPRIPQGVVLPRAQSLATAGPNHSDIDPIHIPEISFRTSRLRTPRKTSARDHRCSRVPSRHVPGSRSWYPPAG